MARTLAFVLQGIDRLSETFDQAGDAAERLQGRMEKFSQRSQAAGMAAGLAFAGGMVKTLQIGDGQAKLAAQLGLVGDEAKKVGATAGKIFANNFGDSIETVNGAVKSVVQNIDGMRGASSAALQEMTQRALTVADVMETEVSTVTAAVSNLMRTGLAKDAKTAMDVIVKGSQLGADKAGDLLDTLNEYPTLFRNMGLDAQSATGLLVQGLQAGARDSDIVADAIKEFSIRAVDGSKTTAQGFKDLGLDADSMAKKFSQGGTVAAGALDLTLDRLRALPPSAARSQLAVSLFGTQAEDLGQALFKLDPSEAAKKLGNFAGATDQAATTLGSSASAKIETFKRTMIQTFVDVVGTKVIPAVEKFTGLMSKFGISSSDFATAAIVLGGFALAMWAVTGAISAYVVIVRGVALVTKAWTIVQFNLNLLMWNNPIAWVVLALVALGVALVIAYKKSDTFRAIVDAAWKGIRTAISYAWNNVILPIFNAIKAVITTVLMPIFKWLYENVIKNYFKLIVFEIKVAWVLIQTVFILIKKFIQSVLAPVFSWLWRNVIQPVWNGIVAGARGLWNFLQPVFSAVKTGVRLLGSAFQSAASMIRDVWAKIKDYAKKPVEFVINTVYTKGIKAVWDKVAGFIGSPKLPDAPRFATGGRITQGKGPTADDVLIRGSRNEYVVNAQATHSNLALIDFINRRGRNVDLAKKIGLAGDPGNVIPGFAGGGLIGWVKGFAGKAKDFFSGGVKKALGAVFNPLKGMINSTIGKTPMGAMIGGIPIKYMDAMTNFLGTKEELMGGPGRKAVTAARGVIGTPYSWGGGGPGGASYGFAQGAGIKGFDCSSLMQYAWYKATGNVMPRTTHTQRPWLTPVSGMKKEGDIGQPHSGHTFMYSGKGKIIEAPFTGSHVREVGERSAWWGRPPGHFMRADSGAVLRPGMNHVYNGTGRGEYALPAHMMNRVGGVQEIHLHIELPLGVNPAEAGRQIAEALREYKRSGGKIPT
jgi:phage-related minor tail protein